MGVFSFIQPPKKSSPAAAIAEMEANLARLRAEHKTVAGIVENHGQRRAEMLLSDAADADIAQLDAAANLAQIRLERLELAELELIERIEAARDSADRSRKAAELEAAATAIGPATKNLETALAPVAEAFAALARSIPPESGLKVFCDASTLPQPATPESLARIILAAAIHDALPAAFEMRKQNPALMAHGAGVERALSIHTKIGELLLPRCAGLVGEEAVILSGADTARTLIVEPLKRRAQELRAGDAEAS
ncbi:hypothetical protein [Methylocystis sp.]|uniref:hypothetical protein n=1 Tax=Methylocystis sp. TaxID=1911079 RepID=UPI0025E0B71D|nr:hypothetical protein [Methylocystis sp.]